jgi:hypothetical protein
MNHPNRKVTVDCRLLDSVCDTIPGFMTVDWFTGKTQEDGCTVTVYSKGPHGGTSVAAFALSAEERRVLAHKLLVP